MTTAFARLLSPLYLRYVAVSAGALAVDFLCFLALIGAGMPPTPASAIGYSVGVLAHWLLSSRAVFADAVASSGAPRYRQQLLFAGSALVGLGATVAIVAAGSKLGLDPRAAKLVAVAVSFQVTFMLRRWVVFA